jgi:hypothetical protein
VTRDDVDVNIAGAGAGKEYRALALLRRAGVTPTALVQWCNTPHKLLHFKRPRQLCAACAALAAVARAEHAPRHGDDGVDVDVDVYTSDRSACCCVDVHGAVTSALRACGTEPKQLMRKLAGALVPSGGDRVALCAQLGIDARLNHWTRRDAVAVVAAVADSFASIPDIVVVSEAGARRRRSSSGTSTGAEECRSYTVDATTYRDGSLQHDVAAAAAANAPASVVGCGDHGADVLDLRNAALTPPVPVLNDALWDALNIDGMLTPTLATIVDGVLGVNGITDVGVVTLAPMTTPDSALARQASFSLSIFDSDSHAA